jgi:hypothetical protein
MIGREENASTGATMFSDKATLISSLLVLTAAMGTWTMFSLFSPETIQERRRRRNHGRVVARGRRPMVSLFCRAPKN